MHSASVYLTSIGKLHIGASLGLVERQSLDMRLQEDAESYCQAAIVSFCDALRGLSQGMYSWATVKLYYSAFYSLRARLAISGVCLFYDGTRGRIVTTDASSVVVAARSPSTHKTVFARFRTQFPNDRFISQTIGTIDSLDWLVQKREEANYGQGRFSEPVAPQHLLGPTSHDFHHWLAAYLTDDLYIHDEDHAMVALPFRLLLDLRSRLGNLGLAPLTAPEVLFIRSFLQDANGPYQSAQPLLS